MNESVEILTREPFCETSARRAIAGEGFRAELVELHGADPYDFNWDGASHYLALHDIQLADGETIVDGVRRESPQVMDSLTFAPRRCAVTGWSEPSRRANSFVALTLGPSLLSSELERDIRLSGCRPELYFKDPKLAATLLKLRALLKDIEAPNRAQAEALALLAALELLARNHGVSEAISKRPGGLQPQQAARLREYIAEHLAADISLNDLAALVGLSRFYFSRSFKAAFGVSPQQYLIDQRMLRARALLASSSEPIGAIAGVVGYRGPARFSAAFREAVGCSPTEFRRRAM